MYKYSYIRINRTENISIEQTHVLFPRCIRVKQQQQQQQQQHQHQQQQQHHQQQQQQPLRCLKPKWNLFFLLLFQKMLALYP